MSETYMPQNLVQRAPTQGDRHEPDRDSIGDGAITGDVRWSGSYGVNVDYIARSHCSVEVINIEDIRVRNKNAGLEWGGVGL